MKPVIQSLLDNDLYKFTMLQTFFHYERSTTAKYSFKCRSKGIDFSSCFHEIKKQIEKLGELRFKEDELEYLRKLPYIRNEFVDFLKDFRLNPKYVDIVLEEDGQLNITFNGLIVDITMFEIPVLAIVNEVYFRNRISHDKAWKTGTERLNKKLKHLKKTGKAINFLEFGSRRRFSFEWHDNVVKLLIDSKYPHMIGTSNVYFAKKYNLTPIGTMAHEWIMGHSGISSVEASTELALQRWIDFYHGQLGIALTDTYTTDYFISKFGDKLARLYDGVRHDSGDWKEWGYKFIENYKKLGIDPMTKKFIFSDGLDFKEAEKIYDEFNGKVNLAFGIGTNITNDVGVKPIQIVIKMMESNGKPTIKVSDTPGKTMCEDDVFKRHVLSFLKNFNLGMKSESFSFS